MAAVAAMARGFDRAQSHAQIAGLTARAWSRSVSAASPFLAAGGVLLLLAAMLATLFLASFDRGATIRFTLSPR